MLFDINNPRPVPPVSGFVTNFVNSLGKISGSIPVPESLMLTRILPLFFSAAIPIAPSFVNFTALASRLEITWEILSLSASTIGRAFTSSSS